MRFWCGLVVLFDFFDGDEMLMVIEAFFVDEFCGVRIGTLNEKDSVIVF